MKMIQIIAKNEDIPEIVTRLEEIGINAMTRLKIADWIECLPSQMQESFTPDESWEVVFSVISDNLAHDVLQSIRQELCNTSIHNPGFLSGEEIHVSICDVEKEFDII